MASIFCEMLYKIYPETIGPRSNTILSGQWASVDWRFGRDLRLRKVRAVPTLVEGFDDYPPNGQTVDYGLKWTLIGTFRDVERKVIRNTRGVLYDDFVPSPAKTFNISNKSLFLSDECPTYEPDCLFVSGFRPQSIQMTWSESYSLGDLYFGRLWLEFEFEAP